MSVRLVVVNRRQFFRGRAAWPQFVTSFPKLAHYYDASSKLTPYAFQWKVQENVQFPVRASASDRINQQCR